MSAPTLERPAPDEAALQALFDATIAADHRIEPLDRDKAQWMAFAGIKQPSGGFRPGLYRAIYRVERDGKPAIEQAFGISLRP